MNSQLTYFIILAASLAGPLALSFDKKVSFYKKWKFVFPAMIAPAVFYILWDIYFTSKGVWSFNEKYITGYMIFNLPVEEVLFFIVVPFCCVFIYECIVCYFPRLRNKKNADSLMRLLAVLCLLTGFLFHEKYYTGWTFSFCGFFILCIYLFRNYFRSFDAAVFLVSFAVCLLPFLLVNGFLTSLPVVLYNNNENTGLRIFSIPFEDIFYGMLLILMNVLIYEKLKGSRK